MKVLVVFPERSEVFENGEDICRARFPELDFRFAWGVAEAPAVIADAEVVLAFFLPPDCVERASELRWVQSLGAGVDGLAAVRRLRPQVLLSSARGLHGAAVPEAALSMMLAMTRHLPVTVRDQEARRWTPRVSGLLSGASVGIVGTGLIGQDLARRCRALDMQVTGFSASPREIPHFDAVLPRTDLLPSAPVLDYLVLVAPLDEDTRNLAGADLFTAMKPSAYLINVGRGGLVDEPALEAALRAGDIAGAALDVFVQEPLPQDHPFWSLPNLMITPHAAGRREGYLQAALDIFADNLAAYRDGRPMPTQVVG